MEARIVELETKLAFQEHTIQQLDEVIQDLMAKLEKVERQISDLAAEQQNSMQPHIIEKPPHY